MPPTYFTLQEAKSKLNRRVVTTTPFVDISVGDYGMVTDYYKMGTRYGLTIKWDRINITDGFSKDECEEFLREI